MINVYFNFNGNAREVIYFYKDVFDTDEPKLMTFADFPNVDPRMKDWITHGVINVNGQDLMFSDTMPDHPMTLGGQISLLISSKVEDDIRRWFDRLSDKAHIQQALAPSFFSPLYGSLVDKFGVTWQFYLEGNVH